MGRHSNEYHAIHQWLNRHYPKTGVCEECGEEKRTDYAFQGHPEPHTRRRSDYRELCPPCHGLLDRGRRKRRTHCKHGHEFTPENTIHRYDGHRGCRECQNLIMRDYMRKRRARERASCLEGGKR